MDNANGRKKTGVGIPNNVVTGPRLEGCGGFFQKRRQSIFWPGGMACANVL